MPQTQSLRLPQRPSTNGPFPLDSDSDSDARASAHPTKNSAIAHPSSGLGAGHPPFDWRSDPDQQWVLFAPPEPPSASSPSSHSLSSLLSDPFNSPSPSMPRHDGRGRFDRPEPPSSSPSPTRSDRPSIPTDDFLFAPTLAQINRSTSDRSPSDHSFSFSPSARLSSDSHDDDDLFSISSSISFVIPSGSLGGSTRSSLSPTSEAVPESLSGPTCESIDLQSHQSVLSEHDSVRSSCASSGISPVETQPPPSLPSPAPSSSRTFSTARRNSFNLRSPASVSARNLPIRRVISGENIPGSHSQTALRFITRVATKIMDLDQETVMMIAGPKLPSAAETESIDSPISPTPSSTSDFIPASWAEARQVKFSIGDGDNQSSSSSESDQNDVISPLNLSGFYPPDWLSSELDGSDASVMTYKDSYGSSLPKSYSLSSLLPFNSDEFMRRIFYSQA